MSTASLPAIRLTRRLPPDAGMVASTTASLPLDIRTRSRARIRLDDGRDAGFVLDRGHVLRDGDLLADADGRWVVRIVAADESVSTLHCDDALQLARACYHLGNRHVPLQIGPGFARYRHDHVLDDMLRQMGLNVTIGQAPFEPEAGAYHGHPHDHDHDHGHAPARPAD